MINQTGLLKQHKSINLNLFKISAYFLFKLKEKLRRKKCNNNNNNNNMVYFVDSLHKFKSKSCNQKLIFISAILCDFNNRN